MTLLYVVVVIAVFIFYNEFFTDSKLSCDLGSADFCLFLFLTVLEIALVNVFLSKFRKDYISLECECFFSKILEGLYPYLDAG